MHCDLDGAVRREIHESFLTFQGLVRTAEEFVEKKTYLEAAVAAQIAASYASYNHTGEFVSPKLEQVLLDIGTSTTSDAPHSDCRRSGVTRRVLHVITAAADVGGDTRFVWRWIQRDTDRSHSVALTYQRNQAVPQVLVDAVMTSGGTCHVLDAEDVIGRARALRRIARNADVVFLHVYPEDVVPLIAFANRAGLPPTAFVVQADHQFCLGMSISDLVVHLRASGMSLSIERRGIDRERMGFLPIPLAPVHSRHARSQAKQKLGFSEDTVVLLSIARAFKYVSASGPGFAEVAANVLEKYKSAVLVVVGPDNVGHWKTGQERTGGRILAVGRRSDTSTFYEAADIYLDSFPFSSNTSLLEAANYGLPLVSYAPYSEQADVLGAGAPGFDSTLLRLRNREEFEATISRLIEDQDLRAGIGERARTEMARMHSGSGWHRCLAEVYRKLVDAPPASPLRDETDRGGAGEVDVVLKRLYSASVDLGGAIDLYARQLPYATRLRLLHRMLKITRSFSFSMFLPTWLGKRLGGCMRGWKQLLGLDRRKSTNASSDTQTRMAA